MCEVKAARAAEGETAKVGPADAATKEHVGHKSGAVVKLPVSFLVWCAVKTWFQLGISAVSIAFIMQSGFFVPGGYDATVWSRESLAMLFVPQAVFEMTDLAFETWITLSVQRSNDHLPWDSIVHHTVTALYYAYIWAGADTFDHGFLGLPVAGLSCQVIGWLYTAYRLHYRFPAIGLTLLLVQTLYRCPLAFASILRAAQHYKEAPLVHFGICLILAHLDIRWTAWSYKLYCRMRRERRRAGFAGANAYPHLKAL